MRAADGRVRRNTSGAMSTTPDVWVSKMGDGHVVLATAGELGQPVGHRAIERQRAVLDQLHQGGGEDRLGDRGEEEQPVDRLPWLARRSEDLLAQRTAGVADGHRRQWHAAAADLGRDGLEDRVEHPRAERQ